MGVLSRAAVAVLATIFAIASSGCGGPVSASTKSATDSGPAQSVRIGYFPNLTHAPAIVGVQKGFFSARLGDTKLVPMTFNAGPAAIEALFSGALDMAFVGPNPTVNGFTKSNGTALRVVAGAASGGAGLVVRDGITTAAALKGKKIATPQLGNTQDVALRHWLQDQGLSSTAEGGGDVSIMPQDNSTALQAFSSGAIDGAWVPEPYLTRMIQEGGGHLLVNEKDLWPDGKFVVTNLIVRKDFLDAHPATVSAVIQGELDALDFMAADPAAAKESVNAGIMAIAGQKIQATVLDRAWSNVDFTFDPLAATLVRGAANAEAVGLLPRADLTGLY
ncbi:MAG TPA: ABC transporter substrate-binding protein, partial [Micrococcaceae bacterium]